MGRTSSSVTPPIEGSAAEERDRAPASIHSRIVAIWLGMSGLPPFGIAPFSTIWYNRLSRGFPGVTTGPSSPPLTTPAKVLRSSSLIFTAEPWQGTQLAWKIGSTLVSKATVLFGSVGGDWAKRLRASIRLAAHQRQIGQRVILANVVSPSLSKLRLPFPYCRAGRARVEIIGVS